MDTGIAVTVAVIVAELDRLGVDPEPLLETYGWRRETLEQPLERLPRDAILEFVEQACQLADDPVLHMRAAAQAPPGAYHLADYMTMFAPTIAAGFGRILRHFELVDTAVRFELDTTGDPIVATLTASDGAPAHRLEVECLLFALTARLALLSPDTGALWLELRSSPDGELGALAELARCPVRVGRHDRFAMSRQTWQARSSFAEPTVAELLARLSLHGDSPEPTRQPADTVPALRRRVESVLVRLLRAGQATVSRVARRLELSPRTLQRRLTALGINFSDLLDDTRRRLARRYLSDESMSVTDIALRLGYAETSAFSRAFGRWYGRSPSDWRKAHEDTAPEDHDIGGDAAPGVPTHTTGHGDMAAPQSDASRSI